jgi:hypothetical protein
MPTVCVISDRRNRPISVRTRPRALEKRLPPADAAPSFTEMILDLQRFNRRSARAP